MSSRRAHKAARLIPLPAELEAIKEAGVQAKLAEEGRRIARRRYRNQRHAVLRPRQLTPTLPMHAFHFLGPAVYWGIFPQFMQQPAGPQRSSMGAPVGPVCGGFGNDAWITPVCVPCSVPEPMDPDPLEEVAQVTDLGDQLLEPLDNLLALDLEVS